MYRRLVGAHVAGDSTIKYRSDSRPTQSLRGLRVASISRSTACLFRSVGSGCFRLFRLCFSDLRGRKQNVVTTFASWLEYTKQTFSASSFALASSSARRFSSSACAFVNPPPVPDLFLRLASLASFSSCLMRLIRGSAASATSTMLRRRAVSSFLRRARSALFFFSVYRLSSRLYGRLEKKRLRKTNNVLVASFVYLFVQVLEAAPTVEIVPKVVERLDFLFRVSVLAE